ncbi:DUF2244 domain-containing protein [Methylovirgula sp. 4M-Z18]|uniref:DUF2244 domain-containing protein n=1 Tax=Methylovirgula sp. 4M-Z18 TaxID=2293567 RepID=UPI000E2F5048|nr:DUF2244 domain-containing protein [Methylovirgula sp. 4M-Z18]RFB79022.1 DUF2244 domain-containing protein [Methylovirgula sp. 4M-Z18]
MELLSDPLQKEIFSRTIHPHRSMSWKGVKILLCCVGFASAFVSLPFFLLGAWPVVGFLGLDVLLLYFAFKLNFKAARAYELITLNPLELQLAKVSAKGARQEWRFNPVWVRLRREEHEEFGVQRLELISRGTSVEVAGFLGPDAKADFARDLNRALSDARRGAHFS